MTLKDLSHADAASGNSLFTMMQMVAMALGVSIGGGLLNLFSPHEGVSSSTSFILSFLCIGVITSLSALVFSRLGAQKKTAAVVSRISR